MPTGARYLFAVVAWLFSAGVVWQVFLAGLGLLGGGSMDAHMGFGYLLPMVVILLALVAWAARPDRRTFRLTMLLLVVTLIQPNLPLLRDVSPVLAALHPVNALLIFWLSLTVARRSVPLARQQEAAPAEVGLPQDA